MDKTKLYSGVRWCLLLMLLVLPLSVWAQEDQQAMVYIEKVDGSVVKVPITPGYPVLDHAYDRKGGTVTPILVVGGDKVELYRFKQSEIKRIYTGFETTGIVSRKAEADHFSEKVYTLSGRYVGNDSKRLEGQPKGVYIVKRGEKYIKIVRP